MHATRPGLDAPPADYAATNAVEPRAGAAHSAPERAGAAVSASRAGTDRHELEPTAGGQAELNTFFELSSPLLAESKRLIEQLKDTAQPIHAEALARNRRVLIGVAKKAHLFRVARVARGMELYAQSLSTGSIEAQPGDWHLLGETQRLIERMVDKVKRYQDEGLCEQETAEAKCWLLTYRPDIARLVVQLAD
jgi:hypothetical protein